MNAVLKRDNIVMHIDVNSAFLSWQAAYNRQIGIQEDIREIPAVIGGSEERRHGIVLAKSIPAKKLGIKTGESLWRQGRNVLGLKSYLQAMRYIQEPAEK